MKGICVKSEIKPLKKVLLHRPGNELLNLTPDTLQELLFDDIPYLEVAQKEHDAFAKILNDNGVEVVYLENLMTEVLELHPELVKPFLHEWLVEGDIHTKKWQDKLTRYLTTHYKGKDLVLKTMLPKVESCIEFVTRNGRGGTALITSLERASEALEGKTGTVLKQD